MATTKKFAVPGEDLRELVRPMGYCFASDRIMVDGEKVGYMYREAPDDEQDSGWRFFAGDETQAYSDDDANVGIYGVNTVANYDPAIIPYLETAAPCAFEKVAGTARYRAVERPEPESE